MAQSIKRTKSIDSLVVHHTVIPGQNLTIAQAQAALNANQYAYDGKPPYHYIIGKDWDYQGRPYDTIGYHAGSPSWNEVSIGIALMGNFDVDNPTAHQKKRLGEVIKSLMQVYNIPRSRVFLHKQVRPDPTSCPGAKITQDFISNLLTTNPMPTCEQELAAAKKFDAEERVPQIQRLQAEVMKLTDMVNSPTDGIQALKNQVIERDSILDEKRAEIIDLKKQLESCGLTAEQQMSLDVLARLKAVLKELA